MIIGSVLLEVATVISALAALVAALGSSVASVLGKQNKTKIDDVHQKVEKVENGNA